VDNFGEKFHDQVVGDATDFPCEPTRDLHQASPLEGALFSPDA
jgi:hypothetical protein